MPNSSLEPLDQVAPGRGLNAANRRNSQPSAVAFPAGPTISEVFDQWTVDFNAERITVSAAPTITQPVVTFGSTILTVTG